MFSSKEILATTGLSRATLNNYISLGILPRPVIRQPEPGAGDAPALGYFPSDALDRIEQVRKLKSQGLSMSEIAAKLAASVTGAPHTAEPEAALVQPAAVLAQPLRTEPRPSSVQVTRPVLSIDDIDQPAYMINYNFQLTWFNESARELILGFDAAPPDSESRNIFQLATQGALGESVERRRGLFGLYAALGKTRLSKDSLLQLVRHSDVQTIQMVSDLYDCAPKLASQLVVELPCTLPDALDGSVVWKVYGLYFREGILIIHTPAGDTNQGLTEFMTRRDMVVRNLLSKQLPVLTPLAVLLADLQGSVRICSELPPDEYFELIKDIWSTMGPIFRKYFGTYGKHVGDGMVYYFFPQPDSNYIFNALACAQELKSEMRKISKKWQLRKNWLNELYLNIGLHEGTEWLGTFQSATNVEFAVLGDTINHAARLSDFARHGAIWATKNLVSKLSVAERSRLEFGIGRRVDGDREQFVASSYSQLGSLIDLSLERHEKLREIANLPVTEIRDVRLA